jgi:outer membrane protein assembly factor BamB
MGRDLRGPDLSISAIGDRLARASRWLRQNETISFGGGFVVLCGLIVAGYLAVRRPPDVVDTGASFSTIEEEVKDLGGDWPFYGLSPSRTRYLPAKVRPPYRRVWTYKAKSLMEFSPIYAEGRVYGENNDASLFALDAETGKRVWRRKIGQLNASSPAYADGRIYAVALEPGQVLALDADSGKTVWKRRLPGRVESSPVIANDRVFVGCEDGKLRALNVRNGKTSWETPLSGAIKAAPALVDGILYAADYGGAVSAVRAKDGKIKWSSGSQGSSFGRSGRFYSTPAVVFGRVYVGNIDGRVYSLEASSGDIAWTRTLGGYVYAGPAVADTPKTPPTVYIGSYGGNFYALDAKNGSVRWQIDARGRVNGAASVVGEIVYFASIDNPEGAVGVRTKDGKRVWQFSAGAYNPIISDGNRLFLTGYRTVAGLKEYGAD